MDYENPPKNKIKTYRRKEIIDRNGYRNLLTIAILKDGSTVATSYWRPINKPKSKLLLKRYLRLYPKKVVFENNVLDESARASRSIFEYLESIYE